MIEIKKPYITNKDGRAYLRAPVIISRDTVQSYLETTGRLVNCSWLTDEAV